MRECEREWATEERGSVFDDSRIGPPRKGTQRPPCNSTRTHSGTTLQGQVQQTTSCTANAGDLTIRTQEAVPENFQILFWLDLGFSSHTFL